MILKRSFFLLCVLMWSFIVPELSFSEVIGNITRVEGRADIMRVGKTAAETLKIEEAVSIGDIVRTKSDGRVEITFVDKTVMMVGPKSRLGIDEYLFKPEEGKRSASLKLYRGKTGFDIWKADFPADGNKFEMKTRTAIAGVRGTSGLLFTGNIERVYVKEGTIEFSNPLGSVLVTSGRVGEIVNGGAPVERPFSASEYDRQEERITPKAPENRTEWEQKGKGTEEWYNEGQESKEGEKGTVAATETVAAEPAAQQYKAQGLPEESIPVTSQPISMKAEKISPITDAIATASAVPGNTNTTTAPQPLPVTDAVKSPAPTTTNVGIGVTFP